MLKAGGGGCTMILWLAKQLSKRFDVTFVLIYEDMVDKNLLGDLKVIYLTKRYPNKWLNRLKFVTIDFINLYRTLRKGQPDVVVSFGNSSFWAMIIMKLWGNFKILVSERRDPNYNRSREELFIYKCYQYADSVVFQSEGAQNIFLSQNLKHSVVIPNPVNVPQDLWNIKNTDLSVANVARLELVAKRQDLLINAIAIVKNKFPGVVLHLYGGGDDMDFIKKLIEEKKVSDNVVLHGNVKNIKQHLLKHRVFAFSSDYEGVPNALLEAMSIGMPVVSTDCSPGGAAMLLGMNEYGILVSRNNAQSIADAIISYFEDDQLAQSYGRRARESCSRFNEERIAQLWVDEINYLCNNKMINNGFSN